MAAPTAIGTHSRVSGVWERMDNLETRVSGVWQPAKRLYVKEAGEWKTVFVDPSEEIVTGGNQVVTANDTSSAPWSSTARYTLYADGQASRLRNPEPGGGPDYTANWKTYEYGRDCEVNYTFISTMGGGSFDTDPAMSAGVWYDLDETRYWNFNRTAGGFGSYIISIGIRNKAVGIASAKYRTVSLVCENGAL